MACPRLCAIWALATCIGGMAVRHAVAEEVVLRPGKLASLNHGWALGQSIPVINDKGEFQYISFPVCNETGRPLELVCGSEADINWILVGISDPLFHLLAYYIHNDAPLSCRLPTHPPSIHASLEDSTYTNLQIALSRTLQLSHLHINPQLNVIVHTTSLKAIETSSKSKSRPRKGHSEIRANALDLDENYLLAASAYSLPYMPANPKDWMSKAPQIIIGDNLPLIFSVRWFSERTLPPSAAHLQMRIYGSQGLGGHVHLSTVIYCLLSFGGGVAVSLAYWRGFELPRRLQRYGVERVRMGFESGRGGYAFLGNGKRD